MVLGVPILKHFRVHDKLSIEPSYQDDSYLFSLRNKKKIISEHYSQCSTLSGAMSHLQPYFIPCPLKMAESLKYFK